MSKLRFTRGLFAFLLSAVGVFGLVGPSRAAIFIGSFDPAYGGSYGNLGFRGQATILVPDACLGFDGVVFNGDACSNNGLLVQSATVELYDITDPFATTLDSGIFAPPDQSLINVVLVDGNLIGANSYYFGGVAMNTGGEVPLFDGTLWMRFFQDISEFAVDPVFLCDTVNLAPNSLNCTGGTQSNGAVVTFARIPEPATVSLLAVALGAGCLARRRRTSKV